MVGVTEAQHRKWYHTIRPEFFYYLIYENFFSDLGSGDEKKKKNSSENEQLTGHFQSFFLFSFSELFFIMSFFYIISLEKNNSKTSN